MSRFLGLIFALFCMHALTSTRMAHAEETSGCFQATIECLFWNAREDRLAFAVVEHRNPEAGDALNGSAVPVDQDFNWDAGARLSFDYLFACSTFDLELAWTFFQTCSFNSISNSTFGVILAAFPFSGIIGTTDAINASSFWNLDLDILSLDLGYSWCSTIGLALHPYFGVIGTVIRQQQSMQFVSTDTTIRDLRLLKINDFWGVGPHLGFDLQWAWRKNYHLLAKLNGAIVFGRFHTKNKYTIVNIMTDDEDLEWLEVFFRDDPFRGRPMADAYIGFGYHPNFYSLPLELAVGYEIQYWWSQWHCPANFLEMTVSNGGTLWGDLLFHGFVITASIAW